MPQCVLPNMPLQVDIDQVEDQLAQTQCTECGYPSCRAYAAAIVAEEADINRCRPGGEHVQQKLAKLTGKAIQPLYQTPLPPTVAQIDEDICIGCTKCIQACPTDAIIGAPKQLHTIIASDCTGCGLCLPPCPVNCIALIPASPVIDADARAADIRQLVDAKKERESQRLAHELGQIKENIGSAADLPQAPSIVPPEVAAKIKDVRAAAQQKYSQKKFNTPRALRDKKQS